jgi:hypothetical protein
MSGKAFTKASSIACFAGAVPAEPLVSKVKTVRCSPFRFVHMMRLVRSGNSFRTKSKSPVLILDASPLETRLSYKAWVSFLPSSPISWSVTGKLRTLTPLHGFEKQLTAGQRVSARSFRHFRDSQGYRPTSYESELKERLATAFQWGAARAKTTILSNLVAKCTR